MSLACYDPKLDPLADLAGDFDYLSTVERESWNARQWTQIAGAMGWAAALDQRLSALRGSRLGLAALDTSALDAFAEVSRGWSEEPARSDRAKIRAESLTTIRELSPSRLWRVESNVGLLPGGACYGLSHWRPQLPERSAGPQVVQLPQRSFLADAGPSYFGDPPPALVRYQSGCGWQTPLRLSLGTYPWIYGHRLQAPAPGLAWRSSGAHQPALRALEIATELWHAEGNLRQDARDVVAHWRHWRATTSPLFAALPDANDARTPGEPTRRGLLIEVFQGSDELAGITGPRGLICAAAYNFVEARFAAFFAMRRSLLRARSRLSPSQRALIEQSADPCVRLPLRSTAMRRA
jgi:hypothetical protein